MPSYKVKENNTVRLDNETYKAGDTVELSEKQAAEIPWALEPRSKKKGEESDGEGEGAGATDTNPAGKKKEKGGK